MTDILPRMSPIAREVARRRTFAIIPHPAAGKTTLTEKLLLYAGAIHIAGSVKARKATRHATSDWMEIEKQRGISVASSVMQAEYRGCVINLLDTPGHQDFSEDTYRVLTAVDAALMVHASSSRHVVKGCLALHKIRFTFLGKASHAAAYPEHGVNALDAVLLLFQGVAALRQHLPDTVRVHGIITDGGKAPNIVPERAQAYFYVRGETDAQMHDAVRRVTRCARAAATSTGCRLRLEEGPYTLSTMRVNPVLAGSYRLALALLGVKASGAPPERNRSSSDIGHVSPLVPSLQPNVPISGGERVEIHTRSFEEATTSPAGVKGMMEGIRALALTAYDLFADPRLVREAWRALRQVQGRS